MNVICPNCQRQVKIEPSYWSRSDDGILQRECPGCQALIRLTLKVDLVGQKQTDPPPQTVPVVVAVDGEATRELIREILAKAGYEALEASTGREALSLLEKHCPPLTVLDVGLPQMFGFQVCEVIKRKESLKSVKVILVAAIHDKDTYKREPRTLYGADDYIERHRLQDGLIPKIEKLLNQKKPDVMEGPQQDIVQAMPVDQQPTPSLPVEKPRVTNRETTPQPPLQAGKLANTTPEHEAARRLARIIVSDIALYNPERVKEALQKNIFYEMLMEEIEEGKKLYNERVTASIRSNTNYFQDALESFIKNSVKPQG